MNITVLITLIRRAYVMQYAIKPIREYLRRLTDERILWNDCSYDRCGCVNPIQWSVRSVLLPGTDRVVRAPICYLENKCMISTEKDLENLTFVEQYCSECNPACSTTDFVVAPSSSAAPSKVYAEELKSKIESFQAPLSANWNTSWMSDIENNYVGLDVVCQSAMLESLTEQPSIRPMDVLSNVGGQSGLWIGVSFLSVMELIEMLYRLAHFQYNAIAGKGEKTTRIARW